ncbi:MAG: hypothetical protein KF777_19520 [Planctomycetaceae bacterium]|nr:hypothetical protein [Planctomycetaceae bacterium]
MALSRSLLEQQLQRAEAARTSCEQSLSEKGVPAEGLAKSPTWRARKAEVQQLKRRLAAVAAQEAIDAEVANRSSGEEAAE